MEIEEIEEIDSLLKKENDRAQRMEDQYNLRPVSSFVVSKRHFDKSVQSSLTENRPLSDFLSISEEYITTNLKISESDGSIILTFLPDESQKMDDFDKEVSSAVSEEEESGGGKDPDFEALEQSWESSPKFEIQGQQINVLENEEGAS